MAASRRSRPKPKVAPAGSHHHTGASIEPHGDHPDLCHGCHADSSEDVDEGVGAEAVPGYVIKEPGASEVLMWLCRDCAVKLALRVLELEVV